MTDINHSTAIKPDAEKQGKRKLLWEKFFEEMEHRGQLDNSEIRAEDISPEHFLQYRSEFMNNALSLIENDYDDVEVEDNTDDENDSEEECDEEICDCDSDLEEEVEEEIMGNDYSYLKEMKDDMQELVNEDEETSKLANLIEVELQSDLKYLAYKLFESHILQTDNYDYWFKRTIKEKRRLKQRVPKEAVRKYLALCKRTNYMEDIIQTIHETLGSNMGQILVYYRKTDPDLAGDLRKALFKEWGRLTGILPLKFVSLYALEVLTLL